MGARGPSVFGQDDAVRGPLLRAGSEWLQVQSAMQGTRMTILRDDASDVPTILRVRHRRRLQSSMDHGNLQTVSMLNGCNAW